MYKVDFVVGSETIASFNKEYGEKLDAEKEVKVINDYIEKNGITVEKWTYHYRFL